MDYRQPLVRAPLESLRMTLKAAQVVVERDLAGVVEQLAGVRGALDDAALAGLLDRARQLRARLAALGAEHRRVAAQLGRRAAYLAAAAPHLRDPAAPEYKNAVEGLLTVDIADYLLRGGHTRAAGLLAAATGTTELVDLDVMAEAAAVVAALREHSTARCLAWCLEHRLHLRKTRNPLEFEVRLQQFYVLARQGRTVDALAYARRHLSRFADTQLPTLLRSTLALFADRTRLFELDATLEARWELLARAFTASFLEIHGKNPHVPLFELVGAGLSALRTYSCNYDAAAPARPRGLAAERMCPACSSELGELAKRVPHANHLRSVLDPDPVVLPNGRVYGEKKLEAYARQLNRAPAEVVDPVSLEIYARSDLKKIFPT